MEINGYIIKVLDINLFDMLYFYHFFHYENIDK